MFWYIVLFILATIFGIIAVGALIMFILSLAEVPEILWITLIAGIIAIGLGLGATEIQNANTTLDTDTAQMEITKCDMTSVKLSSGMTKESYFITVGNKYIVEVSSEKYAKFNVGDVVLVEVTTKTTFGETMKPTIALKG